MKAPALNFLTTGEVRILDIPVEGANLTVQNALVNLLSEKDGDPLFPDRGTDILASAVAGFVSTIRGGQHAANFAANDLLFFSREHDRAEEQDKLKEVILRSRIVGGNVLELDTTFVIESGQVLSFPVESKAVVTSVTP